MEVIKEILHALWEQDFSVLSDPKMIWAIYGILFTTLLLENGLLPAAFLPGDSLLLLAGALIAKGVLPFFPHSECVSHRFESRVLDELYPRSLAGRY